VKNINNLNINSQAFMIHLVHSVGILNPRIFDHRNMQSYTSCKVQFSWISPKSRDFDRDVTFTRVLAVTRKWNIAVQYAVKTGKFTYNCITTMNFLTNFTITKFCLCLNIQKSSFCSQNFNVYICQHACVFLVTVYVRRHTTLRPMLFL
jgi:hypothetical protein